MTPLLWLSAFLMMTLVGILVFVNWPRPTAPLVEMADARTADLLAAGLRPLADCPRDCSACLRCLQVDHCVVHRLLEMGLTPGTVVRVVQDGGGPMLLSVRGSRVALGRDLAERLWVELPALEMMDSMVQR